MYCAVPWQGDKSKGLSMTFRRITSRRALIGKKREL